MLWNNAKSKVKYFVSIGAGYNQIPLIKEAKNQGFHVIGIDKNSSSPGFVKCDLKIQESIDDYQEIYTKLQELLFDGEIFGIMTKSYGNAIKTTSFLNEKFNLPFIPFERCDDFINKKKMKSYFKKNSIKNPDTISFTSRTNFKKMKDSIFPIISKPTVGHGKSNVILVETKEKLAKLNSKIKKENQNSIFEQYIEGEEIIAAGIINDGVYHLVDITDKITAFPPYFIDKIHISPSKHYDLFEDIQEVGQKVAESFEISSSPLIMEFIVTEEKELYLIEAVPEFGGEFISDIIIPNRTGYNLIGEMIKAVTDSGFKPPLRKKTKNYVVCRYIIGKEGTLTSFNPKKTKSMRGIIYARIFKDIGAELKTPSTNHDRVGVVVGSAKNLEDALALTEKAEQEFNIRIKEK